MAPSNQDKHDDISCPRKLRSNPKPTKKSQPEQKGQAELVHYLKGFRGLPPRISYREGEDDVEQVTPKYPDYPTRRGKLPQPRGRPNLRAATAGHPQLAIRSSLLDPPLLCGLSLPVSSYQSLSITSLTNADGYDRPFRSPNKRTASPIKTKKGDGTLGKPKADASIYANDLVFCSPSI